MKLRTVRTRLEPVHLLALTLAACAAPPRTPQAAAPAANAANPANPANAAKVDRRCALIATDDDIPSGSATAGALYVPDAAIGRELLTRDVLATAQGFFEGGATCVLVLDSHDGAIDPGPLEAIGARVVTPSNDPRWKWPFFGSAVERAALAALIGFHSRADQGTGFRPHTLNDSIRDLTINGSPRGEVAHAILGLGAFGVPVVLISGDMNAVSEAAELVPGIEQAVVRWRDRDGAVQFLTSEQAATRLRDGARRAARAEHSPLSPKGPFTVSLRTYSKLLAEGQSRTLADAFITRSKAAGWDLLGAGIDLAQSMEVDGDRVTWTTDDPLGAYVSIAVAASHLRGPDNFELVSRGYDAYKSGRYPEAIAAYEDALRQNPYDVATSCRLAAVFQKLGKIEDARRSFRAGFEHEDEIGDDAMKSWCALGVAQTELATGNTAAGHDAARRVLALPDVFGRHEQARKILEQSR